MRVLVTGASGFVGTALLEVLQKRHDEVVRLVRRSPSSGERQWDPDRGLLDPEAVSGFDAVVHLAGEGVASGRWTAARKARIESSREKGTALLAEALAKAAKPPAVLVSASAIGIYGDRGDETLTEESTPGSDFLAGVCRRWEAAAEPARQAGIRVVHPRIGVVLGSGGGALQRMLLPFKLGLGGRLGSGRQWMSWISRSDLVRIIVQAFSDAALRGPVNAVAPTPVTNLEFTKTLGRLLHRMTVFPMPGFMARLAFGEMADALLLASQRVSPRVLTGQGFRFEEATLEAALRVALGR